MFATLLQGYQLLGALYAGFVIGICYLVLCIFRPRSTRLSPHTRRVINAALDAVFYLIATAIAAFALLTLTRGRIPVFMLIGMALGAITVVWIGSSRRTKGKTSERRRKDPTVI